MNSLLLSIKKEFPDKAIISVNCLNNNDVEELCNILNYKQIVMTGMIQEYNKSENENKNYYQYYYTTIK